MPKRSVSRRATRGLVTASLLGVGAPEALVIGVVALLVFGPKGLAEVARNVGKTLKTFQPTIKELQVRAPAFTSSLFARCKTPWCCSYCPPVVPGRKDSKEVARNVWKLRKLLEFARAANGAAHSRQRVQNLQRFLLCKFGFLST